MEKTGRKRKRTEVINVKRSLDVNLRIEGVYEEKTETAIPETGSEEGTCQPSLPLYR